MVENEVKYILKLDGLYNFVDNYWSASMITQYYLPNGIRIRSTSIEENISYTINTKKLRPDYSFMELEYPIDKEVYELLHSQQATIGLTKIRYTKLVNDELWSIDFLLNQENLYFVIAECEMPETRIIPNNIPAIVLNNLVYAVSRREQADYSNYCLANISYATNLLERIKNGT